MNQWRDPTFTFHEDEQEIHYIQPHRYGMAIAFIAGVILVAGLVLLTGALS